jgi:glycosyltransferase involved in cell wall biosynthesis
VERDKGMNYVLITSSNFPKGGASASYLDLFCRGLKLKGHFIRVLILKGFSFGSFSNGNSRKNLTEYGVSYCYLGLLQRPKGYVMKILDELLSLLRLIIFLFSLLGQRKSTTILVYNSDIQFDIPVYLFALAFKFRIVKFIPEHYINSENNGSLVNKVRGYCEKKDFTFINPKSTKLIVFSYYLRDLYIEAGYKRENIMIQPNLTDFGFWAADNTETKYTLGYSGTPSKKDGLYDLFKAIHILQKEGMSISLLVIGDTVFGKSYIPALKDECEKLGLQGRVDFTGLVDSEKVKEYLSECEILAITRPGTHQTKAGFPTKLGEYMALKKPVISTDFGDIQRYFKDGTDIIIADSGNPESIAQKIKWIIENNGNLESIIQNGYLKAKTLLDFRHSSEKLISFLESDLIIENRTERKSPYNRGESLFSE